MALHHTMKINYCKFFGFCHFFRGLTPLKLKIFVQKLKMSNNTQNIAQRSYRESINSRPLHHTMKMKDFLFFFGFLHYFRGLTPLKFKNFDKKLKISNNTQNIAQRS